MISTPNWHISLVTNLPGHYLLLCLNHQCLPRQPPMLYLQRKRLESHHPRGSHPNTLQQLSRLENLGRTRILGFPRERKTKLHNQHHVPSPRPRPYSPLPPIPLQPQHLQPTRRRHHEWRRQKRDSRHRNLHLDRRAGFGPCTCESC